jgi:hypothetical protein
MILKPLVRIFQHEVQEGAGNASAAHGLWNARMIGADDAGAGIGELDFAFGGDALDSRDIAALKLAVLTCDHDVAQSPLPVPEICAAGPHW